MWSIVIYYLMLMNKILNDNLLNSFEDLLLFMFFFACPKKNQKRAPEIDIQPDLGSSSTQLLYFGSIICGNSTLSAEKAKLIVKLL
jgi:hypothetical protein